MCVCLHLSALWGVVFAGGEDDDDADPPLPATSGGGTKGAALTHPGRVNKPRPSSAAATGGAPPPQAPQEGGGRVAGGAGRAGGLGGGADPEPLNRNLICYPELCKPLSLNAERWTLHTEL